MIEAKHPHPGQRQPKQRVGDQRAFLLHPVEDCQPGPGRVQRAAP